MRRTLILWVALPGAALLAASWYLLTVPDPFYRDPAPVRTLKRNRKEIAEYIESIKAGRVGRKNGEYHLLQSLYRDGATHVRDDGKCIVITFAFLPTDAVPQLIYSPDGSQGLPKRYLLGGLDWSFFELQQLEENWFFCRWDQ